MKWCRNSGECDSARVRSVLAALLIVGISSFLGACSEVEPPALVGSKMPAPQGLQTLAGAPAQTFDDAGRVVVLNIWATWCPPCRRELPSLEKLHDALNNSRFAVVGLSIDDDPRQVGEYLANKGVSYPNLIDRGGEWVKQLGWIQTYPATVVVGRDGTILAVALGERTWHTAQTVALLEQAWRDGQPILLE